MDTSILINQTLDVSFLSITIYLQKDVLYKKRTSSYHSFNHNFSILKQELFHLLWPVFVS